MTTVEKDKEIAHMLKWVYVVDGDIWNPNMTHDYAFVNSEDLKFHSDANWQYYALDWVENLKMFDDQLYYTQITNHHCNIHSKENVITKYRTLKDFKSWEYYCYVKSNGSNKLEAVFETLFLFSQHLKNKL